MLDSREGEETTEGKGPLQNEDDLFHRMKLIKEKILFEKMVLFDDVNATCKFGTIKQGHGLVIEWYNEFYHSEHEFAQFGANDYSFYAKLMIHGQFHKGLPAGTEFFVGMVMPLSVKCEALVKTMDPNQVEIYKAYTSFAVGTHELSHKMILECCDRMISKGDDPICFELRASNDKVIFLLPTKASQVKQALQNNVDTEDAPQQTNRNNIRYDGDLTNLKPRSNYLRQIRFWVCPVLFLILSWMLISTNYSQKIKDTFPEIKDPFASLTQKQEFINYEEQKNSASFMQGDLHRNYTLPTVNKTKILEDATKFVGQKTRQIYLDEFLGLYDNLVKGEHHKSMLSRVGGIFSFVNIIWFLAIIGITVSLGPALWDITAPLRKFFTGLFTWFAKKIVAFFINYILPNILRQHSWGFLEILLYLFTMTILTQTHRMDPTETVTLMISITAHALLVLCYIYSHMIWSEISFNYKHREIFYGSTLLFLCVCLIPAVFYLQSDFQGVVAVFCFWLGFYKWGRLYDQFKLFFCPYGPHWKNRMKATTLVVFITDIAIRLCAKYQEFDLLSNFTVGLSIFGIKLILTWRVIKSQTKSINRWDSHDKKHQAKMIVCLLICFGLGYGFDIVGMQNEAIMFSIIYGIALISMFDWFSFWVKCFIISLIAYKSAMYLHGNPDFLIQMFMK